MEGHEFVWCDAMRGLHFLRPSFTQSKLVRCVKGRVIIIPSFFGDKASCTRQFESELSLHSLVSLFFPLKKAFSKTYPSFLTVKEGSTFLTKPLFPQGREDVAGYAIASARVLVSAAEPLPTRGCR